MKLNITTAALAYIGLLALQMLVPAFIPMTVAQQSVVATFCQAVGGVLGLGALYRNPDGTSACLPYQGKDCDPKADTRG